MATLDSDWPMHFYISSVTFERNLMTLDRKKVLNILRQVCVFLVDPSTKVAHGTLVHVIWPCGSLVCESQAFDLFAT